jgi:hypothetical protein
MSKLFVRERRQYGPGTGQPRFRIVASEGLDLRVYVPHMRRMELEQLAAAVGCEIVYLPRGEQELASEQREPGQGRGDGRGQGRHRGQGAGRGEGSVGGGMQHPED